MVRVGLAKPAVGKTAVTRVASILDFAPPFAQLLNVSLPRYDGRPLVELLPAGRLE